MIKKEYTIWTNIPDGKPFDAHGNVFYRRLPLKGGFSSEAAAFAWLLQNAQEMRTDRIYEITLTVTKAEKKN